MRSLYQFLLLILLCSSFSSFAQVPLYDSYPSANATIFLDFDGHYVVGTAWNTNGPISGAPANLNATQIIEVCNRVAEDYRPFNINVTTDSTKYWAAPADQRIRVILTTTSDWYSPAGGVSFINSFTWGDHTPAFVFTSLLNFKPKNIAEAASHEAGHTLGLRHQSVYDNICNKTAEYNPGNGTGEIGWAPIMGVGYYKNVTTWHNGPASSGCNVAQDDLAIITGTVNGFGYRPTGREGSSFGSATSLTIQENKFEANGIVVTRTDYYYKISLGVMSPVKIKVNPYSVAPGDNGSNLDVQVKLFSARQNLISIYNPPELLSATIDTILPAGNYYLVVNGAGNAFTSGYASLGAYTIEGTTSPLIALPLHQLELKGKKDGSMHRLNWNINADEKIISQSIEVAANGAEYKIMAEPQTKAREYSYVPAHTGSLLYRLRIKLDDGKEYFSNIISLPVSTGVPLLQSNVVHSTLTVNSPSPVEYYILDNGGRCVAKGKLQQGLNSLTVSSLVNGMYVIQLIDKNGQHTAKFMKQ